MPNLKTLYCVCGRPVRVSIEAVAVRCSTCTMSKIPVPVINEVKQNGNHRTGKFERNKRKFEKELQLAEEFKLKRKNKL